MPITALPIETKVATKADVGLSLVDNTADVSKPVSTFQAAALALKADAASTALAIAAKADNLLTGLSVLSASAVAATDTGLIGIGKLQAQATAEAATSVAHATSVTNPHAVTKAQVGLGSADNTSDINKPISTAQAAVNTAQGVTNAAKADAAATTASLATKAPNLLTGVSFADATDLVSTDVALTAWGKLQAKFTGIAATILSTVLTGLSTATATVVAATDSVLVAIGKLQAQVSLKVGSVTAGTNVTIGGTATAPIINASGVTAWSALTDKTTAPVATDNTSVANALAGKGDALAPIALIGATTLTRALHGNRQITFTGANATLTVGTDAASLWTTDDAVEVHTLAGSAGVPTISFPDGKTITGSAISIVGGSRKGVDSWTVGTTGAAGGFTGGTLTSALNESPIVTLASSATTVAIGAAASNTINITGVTAITAFDSIPAGAVRRLIFAGALTLTHNAVSLILRGGANITTAANDSLIVVSQGSGNWKEFDYSRADGRSLIPSVQTGIQKPWAASGAAVTAPADLLDNVLVAIALPALGPNAMITFEYLMSGTGVGSKTRRVSLSTTAAVGTTMYGVVSTNPNAIGKAIIRNRNNSANQIGNSGNIANDDGYGSASAAGSFYGATATFDTAVAGKFLVFSVTKATAADVFVLEHYCLSIFDPTAV